MAMQLQDFAFWLFYLLAMAVSLACLVLITTRMGRIADNLAALVAILRDGRGRP